jgi:uncharacterized protein
MNKKIAVRSTLLISLGVLVLWGFSCCKKKKQDEEPEEVAFDKGPLLTNMADNLVLPQYNTLNSSLDTLNAYWLQFKSNKNVANLLVLRAKFLESYKKYERVSLFEFGPAETELIRGNLNTFPADTTQIRANIVAGSWTLAAANNTDAKGFPALDYLLYGKNVSDSGMVYYFASSAEATTRTQYAEDLLGEIKTKIASVITQWSSYRNTFVTNLSSDIGSSLGMLVNQLNYELELTKNPRIGIPLGKQTLGIALPHKCEGFYGKYSLQLINETLQNVENVYRGRSVSGADGIGCDDYLSHLGVQHSNGPLNTVILNQFAVCYTKLAALNDPLSDEVTNNAAAVDAAYLAIQQLVVYLKTDMPSAFGIIITYQDTDGD